MPVIIKKVTRYTVCVASEGCQLIEGTKYECFADSAEDAAREGFTNDDGPNRVIAVRAEGDLSWSYFKRAV